MADISIKNLIMGSNQGINEKKGVKRDCPNKIKSLINILSWGGIWGKIIWGKTTSKNQGNVIGAVKATDKLTVWKKVLNKKKKYGEKNL